jgi:hypothetical protein
MALSLFALPGHYRLEAKPVVEASPTPPTKAELKEFAAELRWRREVGGVMMGDMTIATDDRSKALITGAEALSRLDPAYTQQWKTEGGVFITLDASQIQALALLIGHHVSNCFAMEADAFAQIDAEDITTFEALEQIFDD